MHPLKEKSRDMVLEKITTAAAGGAVVSPWWLPVLRDWSEVAGLLLPIAGLLWLLVQITLRIMRGPPRE